MPSIAIAMASNNRQNAIYNRLKINYERKKEKENRNNQRRMFFKRRIK
tara:strand:+ start:223 stop:366 length:144 start_codon:yes stop_codon:yes gene_type:complete